MSRMPISRLDVMEALKGAGSIRTCTGGSSGAVENERLGAGPADDDGPSVRRAGCGRVRNGAPASVDNAGPAGWIG